MLLFFIILFYFIAMVAGIWSLFLSPAWPFTFKEDMPTWLAPIYFIVIIFGICYHIKQFIDKAMNVNIDFPEPIPLPSEWPYGGSVSPPGEPILLGKNFIFYATEHQVKESISAREQNGFDTRYFYISKNSSKIYYKYFEFLRESDELNSKDVISLLSSSLSDKKTMLPNAKIPSTRLLLTYNPPKLIPHISRVQSCLGITINKHIDELD